MPQSTLKLSRLTLSSAHSTRNCWQSAGRPSIVWNAPVVVIRLVPSPLWAKQRQRTCSLFGDLITQPENMSQTSSCGRCVTASRGGLAGPRNSLCVHVHGIWQVRPASARRLRASPIRAKSHNQEVLRLPTSAVCGVSIALAAQQCTAAHQKFLGRRRVYLLPSLGFIV